MRVALYARTSAADQGRITADEILAGLAEQAAQRGWEVALECSDLGPWLDGRREGLCQLVNAVKAGDVQLLLVRTLGHLARSLRHLTELGQLLASHDVALVALDDQIDTTNPWGALRWRDWLDISARLDRHVRSEGAKVARLRRPEAPWGRRVAAVNPVELLAWWEGRGGRRPLPLSRIAQKLGVSHATVRKHLQTLRAAGQVDDGARTQALAVHPLNRGGHPAASLRDEDLRAQWQAQSRGTLNPSVATIARNLRVSRRRVEVRLRELGLLPQVED